MKNIKYIIMSAAVIAAAALMPLTAFADESSAPAETSVIEQSVSSEETHDESVVESQAEVSDTSTEISIVSVPEEESSAPESSQTESSIDESSAEEISIEESSMEEESSNLPEESSQEETFSELSEIIPIEESSEYEEESSEPEEESEESIIEEFSDEESSEPQYELRRDPLSWMYGIDTVIPADSSDYTPPSSENTGQNDSSEQESKIVVEDSETSQRTMTATPTINNETPEIAVFLAERNDKSPMLIGMIIFSVAGMFLTVVTIMILHLRGDFTPSFFRLPPLNNKHKAKHRRR